MRHLIAFLLLTIPAQAWEFSATPICTIKDSGAFADTTVTFDPANGLYAITLTKDSAWSPGPVFTLTFTGSRPLSISTDRHVLSDDQLSISVTDTGFGNVLNGMEFNGTATALLGNEETTIDLRGAAASVAQFRDCGDALTG